MSISYFRLFITRSLSLHFSSSQIVSNIWEKGLTQLMIDNWVCIDKWSQFTERNYAFYMSWDWTLSAVWWWWRAGENCMHLLHDIFLMAANIFPDADLLITQARQMNNDQWGTEPSDCSLQTCESDVWQVSLYLHSRASSFTLPTYLRLLIKDP